MENRLLLVGAALAAAFAASVVATVPESEAQSLTIDQNGIRVTPPDYDQGPPRGGYVEERYRTDEVIGAREARRIARSAGIVDTYDVRRHGPMWVVRGEDRRGRDIRVTISARDGDIVDVERRS